MKTYQKIIILVFGFIIIAAAFGFFVFSHKTGQKQAREPKSLEQILAELSERGDETSSITSSPSKPPVSTKVDLKPLTADEQAQQELENTIKIFVERWGTYSNQTDLSSLRSLKSMMTARMQNFLETYIDEIRQTHPYQSGYYGITTRVVSVSIPLLSSQESNVPRGGEGGAVNAQVSTRREQTSDNSESQTINQQATVDLLKVNNKWLVDGVYWE